MEYLRKAFQFMFGAALIVGGAYLGYMLVVELASWIGTQNPRVAAAVVAGIISVFGYLYNQRQVNKRNIEEAHRQPKIEVYNTFFDILECTVEAVRNDEAIIVDGQPTEEMQKMYDELTRGLIVWGSPKVIRKWTTFRREASQAKDKKEPLYMLDDILRAIREDLKNSNSGLKRGELLNLFIKPEDDLNPK